MYYIETWLGSERWGLFMGAITGASPAMWAIFAQKIHKDGT
jgi:hypothetical protein